MILEKIGLEINRNEYNIYSIENTYMQSIIEVPTIHQEISSQKDTMLGFCDLSNKEFKWKIQLFPNIMQLEVSRFTEATQFFFTHGRYYSKYKLVISKIIFNSR